MKRLYGYFVKASYKSFKRKIPYANNIKLNSGRRVRIDGGNCELPQLAVEP